MLCVIACQGVVAWMRRTDAAIDEQEDPDVCSADG